MDVQRIVIGYEINDGDGASDSIGEHHNRIDVYVKDLRTGHTLHFEHADSLNLYVGRLALKPNGSLIYTMMKAGPNVGAFPNQVRTMDIDGNVLDSALAIDPASLTLNGSTVTWTHNGTRTPPASTKRRRQARSTGNARSRGRAPGERGCL